MTQIACVGSGQLALMLAEAGKPLGVSLRSAGNAGSCAFTACQAFLDPLDDKNTISRFLNGIDVFTFESEHEGLDVTEYVKSAGIPIRPSADFVRTTGDRLLEKTMLNLCGLPVANWQEIPMASSTDEVYDLLYSIWRESPHGIVVKTRRGGYDGKGQWVLTLDHSLDDIKQCSLEIEPLIHMPGCIIEHLIDFFFECSILATRSLKGEISTWPLIHNTHTDSILRRSESPIVGINNIDELEEQAKEIINILCNTNNYIGTIAIECFSTVEGLIINEIAPRVHNSGHWSIEGSNTSQFEQHIRAITGKGLGDTTPCGHSVMINIIGEKINIDLLNSINNVYVHWYGKEVRPKRKVGHITIVADTVQECHAIEKQVMLILKANSPIV